MTIKQQTLEAIEVVLKQQKPYYRSNEFGFPTNRNGYSTHQGAVLRHYLRANGYVNVRVSEIKTQFFIDNAESIKAGIKAGPKSNIFLKPSNTIIMKTEDYLQYKANMFTPEKFKANLKQFPNKPKFFVPDVDADFKMFPLHHNKPTRLAVIGMGKEVIEPLSLEMDRRSQVTKALILKYTERLNNLKTYQSEQLELMTDNETHDLEQRIRDHAEIISDLKTL